MTFEEHKKAIEKAAYTFYQMIEENPDIKVNIIPEGKEPYMTREYLLYSSENSTMFEDEIIRDFVDALNNATKEGYSFRVFCNKCGEVFVNLNTSSVDTNI